ncbi:MAG: flagellin [Labrys sp. (in: a-proteobacteria)]|jgi:flagellin
MSSVTLSAGVRSNLLALQQTSELQALTQGRLATGKKVNSALDNPNSFFTASGLEARAGDLANLLDDMGQAVQTLRAADEGIKAITKLVEAAKAKANQALQSSVAADRATYLDEYNALLSQIEGVAEDSGYKGKNLLKGSPTNDLKVTFNEDATNFITIVAVDFTDTSIATGINLTDATAGSWTADAAGDTVINAVVTAIASTLNTLRKQASTFGTNLTTVQVRQDYTKAMINTLQVGADRLTLADSNEEGAKLLALNTRQQLSSSALSFASQADQNVLRLLQ